MSYLAEYWKRVDERRKEHEKEKILRRSRSLREDNPLGFIPIGKSDYATAMTMVYSSALAKLNHGKSLFSEEMRKRMQQQKEYLIKLQKQKENMKTKNFYHTFEYENRKVTLCLHVVEEPQSDYDRLTESPKTATLETGYAVCVPEDEFNQDLAKRISLGRAIKEGKDLIDFSMRLPVEYAFDLGLLKAFSRNFERRIKKGEVVIKGIR